MLGTLVGLAMLVAATVVFLYYSIWTLAMVRTYDSPLSPSLPRTPGATNQSPSALRRPRPSAPQLLPAARVGHPHTRDPDPTGSAVVGSFLSVVMIRSNRKKAAKAKAAASKKKA
ncbi:hypothetical protein CIB48_g2084 [Xylaria polymorpha]|nr:hypothetical protein CIB48_g2084 [Xylaria polymorpha]